MGNAPGRRAEQCRRGAQALVLLVAAIQFFLVAAALRRACRALRAARRISGAVNLGVCAAGAGGSVPALFGK